MRRPASAPTCSTFHLFQSLPPELRLKIWAYNVPEPRMVAAQCGSKSPSLSAPPLPVVKAGRRWRSSQTKRPSTSPPLPPPPPPLPWCTSPAAIPANLHACHESRAEALRCYALMFGIARQTGHVYFDANQDVLYFGPRDGYMASEAQLRTLLTLADPDELARVRRVALNEALFWEGTRAARTTSAASTAVAAAFELASPAFQLAASAAVDVLLLLRTRLPGLRELILVPRDETPDRGLDTALVPLVTLGDGSTSATVIDAYAAATIARLSCQIQEAIRRMHVAMPTWSPPHWDILALSSITTTSNDNLSTASLPEPAAPPSWIDRAVLPSLHSVLPPPQRQMQQHNSWNGSTSNHHPASGRSAGGGNNNIGEYFRPALPLSSGQDHPLSPSCSQRDQRLPSLTVVFPHASRGASVPSDIASFRETNASGGIQTSTTMKFW
ncbi:hypothetical protein CMQ_1580 [Grosmannia clavigera kw1407]|uniref:2EXR domain-containing protein n=1 Tax=Grosmannia clavigera (strain kw1407 / UAMH 11150) TaxID=655863 RepID=F0XF92_GROCL|nr:uncharacterized protein CMQ_1580 [Grosmannia clavigera kw1407]EFX04652.1 hypothetical protein CMQ_1580 [Grosmannia clavigera kw1407]